MLSQSCLQGSDSLGETSTRSKTYSFTSVFQAFWPPETSKRSAAPSRAFPAVFLSSKSFNYVTKTTPPANNSKSPGETSTRYFKLLDGPDTYTSACYAMLCYACSGRNSGAPKQREFWSTQVDFHGIKFCMFQVLFLWCLENKNVFACSMFRHPKCNKIHGSRSFVCEKSRKIHGPLSFVCEKVS